MKTKKILLLDDSEDRLKLMRSVLANSCPMYDIVFFDNATDTIKWLKENLSSLVLMSLDHDLGPNRKRDGQSFDPGTGKDIVDYLETRKPVCHIVVHSSNYEGRDRMIFSLETAGWTTSRIIPHDDLEWISDTWRPEIVKLLDNVNSHISQKELKKTLANELTQQQFRELRFKLRQWEPDDIFHSLFWLALKTDLFPTDFSASYLLVDLDPPCPISCKEALLAIAGSNLNPSNKLVSFYLLTQFGKQKVIDTYRKLVMNEFPAGVPDSLRTIKYWLQAPSVDLVDLFVKWRSEGIKLEGSKGVTS